MLGYLLQRALRGYNSRLDSYYYRSMKESMDGSNYPLPYGFSMPVNMLDYLERSFTVVSGTYEDLTTYTLVDLESTYDVITTALTLTNNYPDHDASYLYYDFEANHFKTGFTINFELKVTNLLPDTGGDRAGVLSVANALGDRVTVGTDGGPLVTLGAIDEVTSDQFKVFCGDASETDLGTFNTLNVGTQYYCTVVREYGDPGTFKIYIYTDAERAVLLFPAYGIGSITEAHAALLYQYLILGQSDRINVEDSKWAYTVSNVKIISNS